MSDVYVIRNQLGHYWGKGKAWVDGTEPKAIMRLKHEDEAVNTLFELGSKDYDLRGEILAVELSDKGVPVVEPSANLIPKEEPSAPVEEPSAPVEEPSAALEEPSAPAAEPTANPGEPSAEDASAEAPTTTEPPKAEATETP